MALGDLGYQLINHARTFIDGYGNSTLVLLATTIVLAILLAYKQVKSSVATRGMNLPPHIPSSIPFLGCSIEFSKNPILFLQNAHKKYGEVFSFTMVGSTFTYLVGSEASSLFFNSKNEDLNAEDVYSQLTTPVFGKGVAYDVPHKVFLEQKKMFKTGLTIARFQNYVPMIEEETREYFKRWGNEGEKDLFVALSELIIMTASRCLHGKEIRSLLDERIAQLYADLDGGFTQLAWLLPGWIPFPSFIKRDNANKEMKRIFRSVITNRIKEQKYEDDMLNTLIESSYRSGRKLTEDEIAGMLIALLLAGQHTSSTTSSWLGFFISKDKKWQDRLIEEQHEVFGDDDDLEPLSYEKLKELKHLDRTLKETLRLRPPIMTMMRMAKTPQKVKGYTIPTGHQICVSPTVNQRLYSVWKDGETFNPDRFAEEGLDNSEKFSYVPFGAGRHRCIGEFFAYVQIKTIWSVLIRTYELDLVDNYFPEVNFTTMIHTPSRPLIRYKKRSS